MSRYVTIVLYVLGGAFGIRIILAMAGVTDAVNSKLPYLPAPTYLAPVMAHTLYGVLLFTVVISTGTACLAILGKYTTISDDDGTILTLPTGLLGCLGLSFLSLGGISGQLAVGLVLIGALLMLRGRLLNAIKMPLDSGIFIVLLAVAFGSLIAFMWRPATLDYPGTIDIGDITVYMGFYYSLSKSIYPLYNLGVEGATALSYFNNLHTFYALALDFLPFFDIYLFITASLGTFYILAIAWTLRALRAFRASLGFNDLSPGDAALICALFLAAARYPSWVVESPPAVFMVPLALSVTFAVARAGDRVPRLGFAFVLAVVGSALSKVTSVPVLGSYTGLKFLGRVLRHPKPAHLIFLGLAGSAVAIYALYLLDKYGDAYLTLWDPGPESLRRFRDRGWADFDRVIPTALKDLGLLVVLIGTFQLRDYGVFIASALGIACHFLFPFLFTSTPAAMLVVIAGYVVVTQQIPNTAKTLILTGAIMILPHHWKEDRDTGDMLLLWVATLGPAVLIALRSSVSPSWRDGRRMPSNRTWRLVSAALLLALTLAAVAEGSLRIGKKRNRLVVSTQLHDVWLRTRQLTPPDALVFTDQTGNDAGRLTGWNDYSLMAQRQFYLSSWALSELRFDAPLRRQRLSDNDAVISGTLAPTDLSLTRRYDSYYAVVTRGRTIPRNFRIVYENEQYVLYEIITDDRRDAPKTALPSRLR